MRRSRTLATLVFACAVLASCDGVDDAVAVDFESICAEDDRWISAVGRLGVGDLTRCESIGDMEQCHLLLVHPDDPSRFVAATIEVGSENDRMATLPVRYAMTDLAVTDHAGKRVGVGAKVRLIGPASNDEARFPCRIWVRQIEQIP